MEASLKYLDRSPCGDFILGQFKNVLLFFFYGHSMVFCLAQSDTNTIYVYESTQTGYILALNYFLYRYYAHKNMF